MEVLDKDIEKLIGHIYSKDNDLGNQTFTGNVGYRWKFRRNIDETTLFKGHFFWIDNVGVPARQAVIDLFDNKVAAECGQSLLHDHKCFWLVAKDGFYFAKNSPDNWEFKYPWPGL
ncbi:S-protein homolog 29-like [Rutidosis leptorrhynchoides]|uniref:S-protein homolog 29-like n=1 Tax=Rutidosis leptorrhynchoides TaxID=125765 RepID=UPI003A99F942